jgi:hypothetical protein
VVTVFLSLGLFPLLLPPSAPSPASPS